MINTIFSTIEIDPQAASNVKAFKLPEKLPFGQVIAPIMAIADYDQGEWGPLKLLPYQNITLDPTCKVFHYAQEIFEGMKAYNLNDQGPFLFRPNENLDRFNFSARRMAMPEIPSNYFNDAVNSMTSYCSHLIPTESGASLYIRPFMFATEPGLGIKPSEKFKFIVVASPSQAYFKTGSINVLIEREAVRACPGGVGNAKTGGNYAASLQSMINANDKGFDQVLWLDAKTKTNIEEMSGMNFFAVYDKELITPKLTDSILGGITRKSIIVLSKHLGLKVHEREMPIDELLSDISSGLCQEAFACGTAVVITPIKSLGEIQGKQYYLGKEHGEITLLLRKALFDIQEGSAEDPFNWRKKVARMPL